MIHSWINKDQTVFDNPLSQGQCSGCNSLFEIDELVSFTQYGKTKYICSECVYDNELDQKRRVGKFRIGYEE